MSIVKRVAARYLEARTAAPRKRVMLDKKIQRNVAKAFKHVGLDGNGHFDRPSAGLRAALDILETFGLVLAGRDSIISGVDGPKGNRTFHIAYPNPEEPDEPIEIDNSMLAFSWYRRSAEFSNIYDWEVLAYLS